MTAQEREQLRRERFQARWDALKDWDPVRECQKIREDVFAPLLREVRAEAHSNARNDEGRFVGNVVIIRDNFTVPEKFCPGALRVASQREDGRSPWAASVREGEMESGDIVWALDRNAEGKNKWLFVLVTEKNGEEHFFDLRNGDDRYEFRSFTEEFLDI